MTYVIIIAGGIGNRLGAGVPKQFVDVLGKPVIAYTMEHYQNILMRIFLMIEPLRD